MLPTYFLITTYEDFVLRIQETFGKRTELRGMRAALRAWDA